MARLTVTTDDGEVLEVVNLNDYDLTKPLARADLMDTIKQAVDRDKAQQQENRR